MRAIGVVRREKFTVCRPFFLCDEDICLMFISSLGAIK